MIWNIIVGNIIALIASVVMVAAGIAKTKKITVGMQIFQASLFVTADLFLCALTGAVGDFLNLCIFFLTYKKKMNWLFKVIIIALMFASAIFLNRFGYLDFI